MCIKNIIFLLVILPLIAFAKPNITEEVEIPLQILTPKQYISLYAREYGAVESELLSVANCESSFNPNAIHHNDGKKGSTSFGLFQYKEPTFELFSKLIDMDLDYYSYQDQARLTAFIFAKYPSLKSHWSCSYITKVIK